MPVPAIASQSRRVEAQNGPNFSGTKPCNQALEAGPRDHSARRPAEIVVNHLDVAKAAAARDIDEFVLPTLAL
jgi:hypothetical protein